MKGRNKDLIAAWDDARTLAALFERLNSLIVRTSAERPEDAALLSQGLGEATRCLLELRDLVAKLKGFPEGKTPSLQDNAGASLSTMANSAVGLRQKVGHKTRDAGLAMVYKFHQEDVKDLRVAMQQLISSLTLAIHTISL